MWYDDDDTCVYYADYVVHPLCQKWRNEQQLTCATKIFGLGVMKLVETGSGRIFIEFRYDSLLSQIIVEEL